MSHVVVVTVAFMRVMALFFRMFAVGIVGLMALMAGVCFVLQIAYSAAGAIVVLAIRV